MAGFTVQAISKGQRSEALNRVLEDTVLYAVGNLDLLQGPCVGLCGSRHASPAALQLARAFGKEVARQGIVLVSGYARGVDREAHQGALEAGGGTIAVLAEGIQNFRVARELQQVVDLKKRNFLAVSMFEPSAGWTAWRAMQRNKLIVGLSSDLFVIEAKQRGGTIAAAYEAIRQCKRLWAMAYTDTTKGREGNELLLAGKAMPLSHLDDFRAALEEAIRESPKEVRQLAMAVMNDTEEGQ